MPRRFRKSRKLRGSRTHGLGIQTQHRRSRGGRGKAGIHTHRWAPPAPKYAGKRGFRSIWAREVNAINVGELDELVRSGILKGQLSIEGGIVTIDLSKLGYEKLLGKGKFTRPARVIVRFSSKTAEKKIADAGGEIIRPSVK